MSIKYDVALSFAAEDRYIAGKIAESLEKEDISVFFDKYSSGERWGKNLFEYLNKVYSDSKLCIVLLSRNYSESQWTHNEFRNLIAHSDKRPSFSIIPLRIDNAPIPKDFAKIAYAQMDSMPSEELTQIVKARLATLAPQKDQARHDNFHVIKRETGWSVKREGALRAYSIHKTRDEAISNARKIALRDKQSVVVVHGEDGSIESQEQITKE